MKKKHIPTALAAALLLTSVGHAQDEAAAEKPAAEATEEAAPAAEEPAAEPLSDEERVKRVSLGLGFQSGMQLAQANLESEDLNPDVFLEGFMTALKGEELSYDDEQIRQAFTDLQNVLTEREAKQGEAAKKAGEEFLAENAKKEGVTTTESGLQYQVLQKGSGEKAEVKEGENKIYMVHYKGTLPDGTEFDASDGETPVPFPVQGVIPGFSEALKMMDKGAKWKLFIPSDLAYGEQRRSPEIGPNQVLVFELEVVDIQDAPAPQANPGFQLPPGAMPQ